MNKDVDLYDGHSGHLTADPQITARRRTYDEDLELRRASGDSRASCISRRARSPEADTGPCPRESAGPPDRGPPIVTHPTSRVSPCLSE